MDNNKEKWKRYLSAFKDDMMYVIKDTNTNKNIWWSMKYAETLYESPKNFHNGFAFNDGTWFRFPKEYRTKQGKPKAIFLKGQKSVIIELAFFCRFQWMIGVRLKEELVYHMLCFLCDVVKLDKDAFEFNENNKKVLFKIAENILNSEVKQETIDRLKDKRTFCIAKEKLVHLDIKGKASLQAKVKRIYNYFEILKKYDEHKSISQNAVSCGVCISTIKRFKKYKGEVMRIAKEYGVYEGE